MLPGEKGVAKKEDDKMNPDCLIVTGVCYYWFMEFRIKKSWRIFVYVGMSLLFLLSVFMIYKSLMLIENIGDDINYITLILGFLMAFFSFYSIMRFRKEKVHIENGVLCHTLVFSEKKISLDEIDSFKVDEHYFYLIPTLSSKKKLRISSYLDKKYEFIEFLSQRFDDINFKNFQEELSDILSNDSFGKNETEREEKLELAQKTTKIINSVSLIVCFWLIINPNPYDLLVLINILIPIISIWVFFHFKGLVKIDSSKESQYPSLLGIFVLTPCAFGLRILFDYEILSLDNAWSPTFAFSILIFGLFLFRSEELKKKDISSLFQTVLFFLFVSTYAFTSILMLNYLIDVSSPYVYKTPVIDKITPSDDNNFRLVVEPEGEIYEEKEITVTESFFNQTEVGDTVFIELYDGAFNIPWFVIDQSRASSSNKNYIPFSFPKDTVFENDFY